MSSMVPTASSLVHWLNAFGHSVLDQLETKLRSSGCHRSAILAGILTLKRRDSGPEAVGRSCPSNF